jgi:(heptosyl)LPS beta-1,4-glucosyltransferase
MTATLSAVVITKNEESMISDCLERLSWVDEIVVFDSGSTDKTREVASQYTDKVYMDTDWQGYGVQRQRAQEKVSGDWVLMVDADERVSPRLQKDIQEVVKANDKCMAYSVAILPWCFGRFLKYGGWYPAYKVRLYAKDMARYGNQRVHENLEFKEGVKIKRLTGDLLHYTYRDMEHYLTKSAQYAAEWSEQRYSSGGRASITRGLLHGIGCFVRMYVFKFGFLDGKQGFLMAVLSAHSTFVKYADLWTRHQKKPLGQ